VRFLEEITPMGAMPVPFSWSAPRGPVVPVKGGPIRWSKDEALEQGPVDQALAFLQSNQLQPTALWGAAGKGGGGANPGPSLAFASMGVSFRGATSPGEGRYGGETVEKGIQLGPETAAGQRPHRQPTAVRKCTTTALAP